MNLALFGRSVTDPMLPYFQELVNKLEEIRGATCIYLPFYRQLEGRIRFRFKPEIFQHHSQIKEKIDFLCSIGGDGTILDAVIQIGDSGIPIIAINMGRLGFLSGVSRDEILPALENILKGNYTLENRTLLELHSPAGIFTDFPFALNDLTIYKSDRQTMLTIRISINGEFLNSYWADGLIIATPTGSTAYSMSCTGPIVTPGSENFVITPVASHNLTVRPIVIRDDCRISITAEGESNEFFVTLDSRKQKVSTGTELEITRASFEIRLVRLPGRHFFKTIREKLNWGLDARN